MLSQKGLYEFEVLERIEMQTFSSRKRIKIDILNLRFSVCGNSTALFRRTEMPDGPVAVDDLPAAMKKKRPSLAGGQIKFELSVCCWMLLD